MSDDARRITRRNLIATASVTACALPLAAACGGGGGTSYGPSTQSGAPRSGGANKPAGGAALAKVSDIPVGSAVSAKTPDGKPVIVAQPTSGKIVAFSAVCTHMGCTVAPAGKELHCPCHGSKFAAATGKVIHGPAQDPLAPVEVAVKGGNVVPKSM